MKKIFLSLLVLPFFAFQCSKTDTNKCVKGKIIRITCASYVIQVLNNDSIGEDQWKNSMSNEQVVYDNVFSVSNKCKIPSSFKTGDIIYFDLDKPEPNDCVVCAMYDAAPQTQFQVKNISAEACK